MVTDATARVDDAHQLEIKAHRLTYQQIFQAIARKQIPDENKRKQTLARIAEKLRTDVRRADELAAHIPEYAAILGVKETALSQYIGVNFLKILDQTRHRIAEGQEGPKMAAPVDGEEERFRDDHLLKEILERFGPLIQPPDRFIPLPAGHLKLLKNGREIFSQDYAREGPANRTQNGSRPAENQSAALGKPVPKEDTDAVPVESIPVRGKKDEPLYVENVTIITEIRENLGSVLNVSGKLIPRQTPTVEHRPKGEAGKGITSAIPAEETGQTVTGQQTAVEKQALHRREVAAFTDSKTIISEILERFGSVLDIPEKLVPVMGPPEPVEGDEEELPEEDLSDALEIIEQSSREKATLRSSGNKQSAPAFTPLSFEFNDYMNIARELTRFQMAGDRSGYQLWLQGQAGAPGKAMVGLRNLETRQKNGVNITWEVEYGILARHIGNVIPAQIREFHHRLKKFDRIHFCIQRLKKDLPSRSPELVTALKQIWAQVLLLFNSENSAEEYQENLKITLLQFPGEKLRGEVIAFLHPYFKEVERIYFS